MSDFRAQSRRPAAADPIDGFPGLPLVFVEAVFHRIGNVGHLVLDGD
jgi:hypothetical protein